MTRTIESEDFSRREAAVYLRVSVRSIDRLRDEGEVEDFLVRGSVRIPKESLDAYRNRQREAARRRRERGGRPQVKDEFDIAVPFLEGRRTRRAA